MKNETAFWQVDPRFCLWWLAASIVGLIAGGLLILGFGGFSNLVLGGVYNSRLLTWPILGSIHQFVTPVLIMGLLGLGDGIAHQYALRRQSILSGIQWVWANVVGWGLGAPLALLAIDLPNRVFHIQVQSVFLGLLPLAIYGGWIAVSQWIVLRPYLPNAFLWIVVRPIIWFIVLGLATAVLQNMPIIGNDDRLFELIGVFAAAYLLAELIMGGVLTWLLRQPRRDVAEA